MPILSVESIIFHFLNLVRRHRRKEPTTKSERVVTPSRFTLFYVIHSCVTFFAIALTVLGTTAPLAASPAQEYQHTWEP